MIPEMYVGYGDEINAVTVHGVDPKNWCRITIEKMLGKKPVLGNDSQYQPNWLCTKAEGHTGPHRTMHYGTHQVCAKWYDSSDEL